MSFFKIVLGLPIILSHTVMSSYENAISWYIDNIVQNPDIKMHVLKGQSFFLKL